MNKVLKLAVAAAVLSMTSAAMAQATSYYPSWYIAPSINAIDPDRVFGDDHRGEGLGLKFGKVLTPSWDMQIGGTYARSHDNGNRYQQDTLGVDAMYMFSRDRFRPFLLAGVGAEYDKSRTARGEISRTSPYLSFGLGFQYAFTDQWSMQADVRRLHGFLRDRDTAFGSRSSNNNYLTVGLNYYFDKPAAAPVAMAPMPMPQPAPARVAPPPPPPRFEKMTMSATELFQFDRSEIRGTQPKLDDIANVLASHTDVNNIVITGYTDRIGSDGYNQKLSERRANAVKAYLVNKGIDASRLSTVGKGKANPIVECHDKKMTALVKCLEPNRRVEVEQITVESRVQ